MSAWLGGVFEGEWICVYVWLSPFTVHLKLPKHCYWAILQYKIKSLKFEKKETSTQQTLTQVISAKHFIFALFHLSLHPLEVSAITIPILLEKMLPA